VTTSMLLGRRMTIRCGRPCDSHDARTLPALAARSAALSAAWDWALSWAGAATVGEGPGVATAGWRGADMEEGAGSGGPPARGAVRTGGSAGTAGAGTADAGSAGIEGVAAVGSGSEVAAEGAAVEGAGRDGVAAEGVGVEGSGVWAGDRA